VKLLSAVLCLCLSSCAATRPVGEAIGTGTLWTSEASAKPFEAVTDSPKLPGAVKAPLQVITYPLMVVGTTASAIVFFPSMILSADAY